MVRVSVHFSPDLTFFGIPKIRTPPAIIAGGVELLWDGALVGARASR
jgi:hypothetical protein